MKPNCAYYRDWPDMPDFCITNWVECTATGDECRDFTPQTRPEDIRNEGERNERGSGPIRKDG